MIEVPQVKTGSVVGGSLLITGSCVGAGMLGLPILTGMAGFLPTILMFTLACFFMTTTAFFVVEINQWFGGRANFITMVANLLGPLGKVACWILYLSLFYALLVAYIAGSGHHVSLLFSNALPVWVGSCFFVALFGWFVYLGTRSVDLLNRVLMAGKILSYIGLMSIGLQYIHAEKLLYVQPQYSFFALPILVISFGFHNMIPTLSHYLGGDTKRIKQSILLGSLFTLIIYLFWELIVLGTLPINGPNSIFESYQKGVDAAQTLGSYLQNPMIIAFASLLAFFAILTSFLAQSLSVVHFLADGMNIKPAKRENVYICLLALIPPLIFAIPNPSIFYQALNFAGGVCTVILFGIFPVLMIWIGRYKNGYSYPYQVRGGKRILLSILGIATFILLYQIATMMGYQTGPKL